MQTMNRFYDKDATVIQLVACNEAADMLAQLVEEAMGRACRICLSDVALWAAQSALPHASPSEHSILAADVNEMVFGLWAADAEGRA